MPVDIKNKLAFIHIPKNAGTSICKTLNIESNHQSFTTIYNRYPDFVYFTTIRDPYERFISAYEYVKAKESYWHSQINPHPLYQTFKDLEFEEACNLLQQGKLNNYYQFKRQSDFINNDKIYKKINIFKIEEIDKLENFLSDILKKDIRLLNINTSKRSRNNYYNDFTKKIVCDYYKKDFYLGYEN